MKKFINIWAPVWFSYFVNFQSCSLAVLLATLSMRTITSPSGLDFVVNRQQAVAEQEAQVPANVRKEVLKPRLH